MATINYTVSIQRGSITLGSGTTSASFSLTSVDEANSYLNHHGTDVQADTTSPADYEVRLKIASGGGTVVANRAGSAVDVVVYFEVVEVTAVA